MAHRIGQQLGKYRLVRLIGQGGYAEIYLGEQYAWALRLLSKSCVRA